MFEHAATVAAELAAGRPVALAVAVAVSGGGPKPLGSSMVVDADGRIHGSLSGGCVDAAIVASSGWVLGGEPARLERFGADGSTYSPALTCGGTIDVLTFAVAASDPATSVFADAAADREVSVGLRLDGKLIASAESTHVAAALATVRITGGAAVVDDCGTPVLVVGQQSPPTFLIYGAVDLAEPLAALARLAGYHVVVCDARPAFATRDRFPSAHEVVVSQPAQHFDTCTTDTRTVVCVLTHDERYDTPVLGAALGRELAYVGAMGSQRTCDDRRRRLAVAGVPSSDIARLRSPIGLDLGASTPVDTALSVLAEVVAVRNGRSGAPLVETNGPIHTGISR